MSPELMFWFALATKMVVTALFVSDINGALRDAADGGLRWTI